MKSTGQYCLVFSGEFKTELPIRLQAGEQRVGRASECEIQISNPSVSRFHAVIRVSETKVSLVDTQSHNGTKVNNQKVLQAVDLHLEDKIAFGSVVCRLDDVPPVATDRECAGESTIGQFSDQKIDPHKVLTDAQYTVFELLMGPLSEKEIAEQLGNAYNTVHNHVRKVYAALGVKKRADLILRYGPRYQPR